MSEVIEGCEAVDFDACAAAPLNGTAAACTGAPSCLDDKAGLLAAAGADCGDMFELLGCDADLHAANPTIPEGSLVSIICPKRCEPGCARPAACDYTAEVLFVQEACAATDLAACAAVELRGSDGIEYAGSESR